MAVIQPKFIDHDSGSTNPEVDSAGSNSADSNSADSNSANSDSANSDSATHSSLLLRLKDRRDSLAWCEFAAVYEPLVYRLARRRGCQDADAREIVQEVFLVVSKAIEQFDSSATGSFRGWLSTIACNAAIDRFRRGRHQTVDTAVVTDELSKRVADEADGEAALIAEFEQQRREQIFHWAATRVRRRSGEINWTAFWRTSVEGIPVEKVARELNLTVGAVYVARCRILKRIRELVATRWEE